MNSINIIDNQHKSISYDGLAIRCAEVGDSWLALHSQILADSAKYKLFMASQEQPIEESIRLIEEAIESVFKTGSTQKTYKVTSAVERFRTQLSKKLPSEIRDAFRAELALLDTLDNLKVSEEAMLNSLGNHRFKSIDGYDFIRRKQDEATKYYIQSMNLKDSEPAKSIVALYQGDLAVYESWLVSQSIMLDDKSYTLAALRWTLATAALNNLEGLPSNMKKAAKEIRKALLWAVGPENSRSLTKYLLKF